MGRIEYEYPLFKVYYSNNSNIRGNPGCALQCNVWGVHGEISLSSIGAWTPITGPLFGEILLGANSFDKVSEESKAWDSSKVFCLSLFSLLNKIPHEKKIF